MDSLAGSLGFNGREACFLDGFLELPSLHTCGLVTDGNMLLLHFGLHRAYPWQRVQGSADLLRTALTDHVGDEQLHFSERTTRCRILTVQIESPNPQRVQQNGEDAHHQHSNRE